VSCNVGNPNEPVTLCFLKSRVDSLLKKDSKEHPCQRRK